MLEESETIYRIILASFIMPILLAGILIWFFISYQRKKHQNEVDKKDALLREQALLIQQQQAIEHERTRIASEMHDDLGAGLTTIRYLSDKALQQAKDTTEADQIKRIADHSNRLVRNMSEIIWAMNSRYDNAESLVSYLRRYASEFLEEHHLPLIFTTGGDSPDEITIGGEKRRNVFLVFKEILHNSVKYSGADKMEITISTDDQLHIQIAEAGGNGFDPEASLEKGNGLFNCRKRMEVVGGDITFRKTEQAMTINITLPLELQTHE